MVSENVKAVERKRSAYERDVITGFLERLETPGRGGAGEERVEAGAVGAATSNLQNRDLDQLFDALRTLTSAARGWRGQQHFAGRRITTDSVYDIYSFQEPNEFTFRPTTARREEPCCQHSRRS